jgi:hypothetical protein
MDELSIPAILSEQVIEPPEDQVKPVHDRRAEKQAPRRDLVDMDQVRVRLSAAKAA